MFSPPIVQQLNNIVNIVKQNSLNKTINNKRVKLKKERLFLILKAFEKLLNKPYPSPQLIEAIILVYLSIVKDSKFISPVKRKDLENKVFSSISKKNLEVLKKCSFFIEKDSKGLQHDPLHFSLKAIENIEKASNTSDETYIGIDSLKAFLFKEKIFFNNKEESSSLSAVKKSRIKVEKESEEKERKIKFLFPVSHKNKKPVILDSQEKYSKEQLKAIESNARNILVVANPGSGKSTTLIGRTLFLYKEKKVNPEKTLLITFTVKAANEMKMRLLKELKSIKGIEEETIKNIPVSTIHSWAYKLIKKDYKRVFHFNSFPKIIDSWESFFIIKEILKSICKGKFLPLLKEVVTGYSFIRNKEKDLETSLNREGFIKNKRMSFLMKEIHYRYKKVKEEKSLLDFDDLISLLDETLRNNEEYRKEVSNRYSHILVDEVQDCNNHQFRILKSLTKGNKDLSLFVCGDEKQSIYSFRSSDFRNMYKFKEKFNSVSVFPLSINYRSSNEILCLANKTARKFDQMPWDNSSTMRGTFNINLRIPDKEKEDETLLIRRPVKIQIEDEEKQALFLANNIFSMINKYKAMGKEIAVLYRTNKESLLIEKALEERGILYQKRENEDLRKNLWIKLIFDLIQVFYNPCNRRACTSLIGIVISSKREVKNEVYSQICYKGRETSAYKVFTEVKGKLKGCFLEKSKEEGYDVVCKAFHYLNENKDKEISIVLKGLVTVLFPFIQKKWKKTLEEVDLFLDKFLLMLKERKICNVMEIAEIQQIEEDEFIEIYSLIDRDVEKQGGKVILSTIHRMKGLEVDTVFLINCVEGNIPFDYIKEEIGVGYGKEYHEMEERRLFYVACTRARYNLILMVPKVFRGEKRNPSEFLTEIKEENIYHKMIGSV